MTISLPVDAGAAVAVDAHVRRKVAVKRSAVTAFMACSHAERARALLGAPLARGVSRLIIAFFSSVAARRARLANWSVLFHLPQSEATHHGMWRGVVS